MISSGGSVNKIIEEEVEALKTQLQEKLLREGKIDPHEKLLVMLFLPHQQESRPVWDDTRRYSAIAKVSGSNKKFFLKGQTFQEMEFVKFHAID